MSQPTHCALCGRALQRLTRHHLIPKTRHKNKRNKKRFDRADVRERIVWICRPCHSHVHAVFTEKELEYEYNTLEKLAAQPAIGKFTEWIKTKPEGIRVPVRRPKKH
jgi:hypothetical protein